MRAAIISKGITKFGELWKQSWENLVQEVVLKSLEEAELKMEDISHFYLANMALESFYGKGFQSAKIAEILGIEKLTRIEAGALSAIKALKLAIEKIELEAFRGKDIICLVCGFEKVSDLKQEEINEILARFEVCFENEFIYGATKQSLAALVGQRYLFETKAEIRDFRAVAIKNHKNGSLNKRAMFRKLFNLKSFKNISTSPFSNLEFAFPCDGASCIILTTLKKARQLNKNYATIEAVETINSALSLAEKDILSLNCLKKIREEIYSKLNIKPIDLDLIELDDFSPIDEILILEALGFAKRGEGYKLVRTIEPYEEINQKIAPIAYVFKGKKIYVNPSGGLKSRGFVPGANPIAQIIEILDRFSKKHRRISLAAVANIAGLDKGAALTILKKANF